MNIKWEDIRKDCLERDNQRCRRCGIAANEVHHIVPRKMGGTNHLINLVTLCKKHHYEADNLYSKYGLVSMAKIWLSENNIFIIKNATNI